MRAKIFIVTENWEYCSDCQSSIVRNIKETDWVNISEEQFKIINTTNMHVNGKKVMAIAEPSLEQFSEIMGMVEKEVERLNIENEKHRKAKERAQKREAQAAKKKADKILAKEKAQFEKLKQKFES